MSSVVAFTGTASPRPTPARAVLTPTSRAFASTSAPPEFPGLRAASVWITFSTILPTEGRERPRALTTPEVTEPARPCGLPTATTSWPTRSLSALPRLHRGEPRREDPHHREVRQDVTTDDLEPRLAPVGERRGAVRAVRDDVGAREEVAVGGEHHGAPGTRTTARTHAQRRDRRDDALGHRDHDGRVRVDRLVLRRGHERRRHIGVGPSARTCATLTSASRSSPSHSASWRATSFTHHASASLRLRATPASTSVSSTARSEKRVASSPACSWR